jgi:hypothetical protein
MAMPPFAAKPSSPLRRNAKSRAGFTPHGF